MADIIFEGLLQIVITPFHTDGTIDFRSVDRLTRSVLGEGASALTVLGVSSEAAYLDEEERR
ncbi:MAG: dihydrodipicolinate synthase family protein, partial [Actinobacteria bacterium]|nr:dihydrodipicolinate synthase family protein [Actinomycetota bacterium]